MTPRQALLARLALTARAHATRAAELVGLPLTRPRVGTINAQLRAVQRALPTASSAARTEWARAEALWWRLALSRDGQHIARRCAGGIVGPLDYADRLQEATIGVYRAARIFEPERGILFRTHARWWARAQLSRALNEQRLVAVSSHAAALLANERRLPEGLGMGERARALGVSVDMLASVLGPLAIESLDAPVSGDEGKSATFGDLLAGETDPDETDDAIDTGRQWAAVQRAMAGLSSRERRALERHLRGETLRETGKALGVSRERARQLEKLGREEIRRVVAEGAAMAAGEAA